jgi:nitroreductase
MLQPYDDLTTIDDLLSTTKAIRYRMDLQAPVDPAVVTRCIELANYAPNASNSQEWRWVVVTDPEVRAAARYGAVLSPDRAPTAMRSDQYASIYPAVWSFQLALRSRGLGSVMTTAHQEDQPAMAEILDIPTTWDQTCLIPVAHVTGDSLTPSARKPVDDTIIWR